MDVIETYIDPNASTETGFNHIVLEAAIRAIEDDPSVPAYSVDQNLDIRSMAHVESVQALRDLIRDPGFELDLNKFPGKPIEYTTPYQRDVKRGWQTNHFKISSSKGWLVLDYSVDPQMDVRK
ncbi:hypothetical protein D3C81_1058910 [compost metagenome]